MGKKRDTRIKIKLWRNLWFASLLVLFGLLSVSKSYAQSVVLTQPASGPISTPFGWVASQNRYHQGLDIAVPTGTPLTPRGSITCPPQSATAGVWAVIDHGCCVQERWLHLLTCSATNIQTDNTGHSSGPHLHWDVSIKGVRVDPALAIGQNLCDPNVQNTLIADGQTRYPGGGGGGGANSTTGCTTPQPPQQPTNTVTYVPGVPATGTTPAIPPQIITTTPTGQVFISYPLTAGVPPPPLPPSIDTGFVQNVNTNNPVTGCATDTWEAMVNQSVLETRREMVVNETLVAKPDSVLAYACVQQQVLHAGQFTGPIFSETTAWANKQVSLLNGQTFTIQRQLGANSLDGALANAAGLLIDEYLMSFFYHGWLGEIAGNATPLPTTGGGGGGSTATDSGTASPQSNAACGMMAQIWQMAKCLNAPGSVGFPTFTSLINNDPRIYPTMYTCSDSGITQNMINVAKGVNVLFDPAQSFSNFLTPPSGSCAPAISTGVTVQRRQGSGIISTLLQYDDAVCLTPGCSFQGTAGTGTCVP